MDDNTLQIIKKCDLFKNFDDEEIVHIIECFRITFEEFSPKSVIIELNQQVNNVYIVVEGLIDVVKDNYNGDRHLLMVLKPSDIFAEGVVCTHDRISPVTVIAEGKVKMMAIPYIKIIKMCTNSCTFHSKLIYNMMLLLGEKNYILNNKVNILLLHGIREKIIHYLLDQSLKCSSDKFTISMTHTQLADYLNVSRPSMSRELGKLKSSGYIDYYKSTFYIINSDALSKLL